VTVDFASSADGTATVADSDYQAASGTLTFAPGDTSKQITVLVNGDATVEPNETFPVNLSNPANATIADGQGQGTIVNDDECSVVNTTTNATYPDLAPAITAATAGDELDITGACTGNYTLDKNLTLKGIDTAGVKAKLDGSSSGTVVTVSLGVMASISNLRITREMLPSAVASTTPACSRSATRLSTTTPPLSSSAEESLQPARSP
jgi:Calx-beta domain